MIGSHAVKFALRVLRALLAGAHGVVDGSAPRITAERRVRAAARLDRWRVRRGAALAAGLFLAGAANAADFSVGSASEFQAALTAAAANGEADTITLAEDILGVESTLDYISAETDALTILGNVSAPIVVSADPALSVLLNLYVPSASPLFTISGVAFQGTGTGIALYSHLQILDSSGTDFETFVEVSRSEISVTSTRTSAYDTSLVYDMGMSQHKTINLEINGGVFQGNGLIVSRRESGHDDTLVIDSVVVSGSEAGRAGSGFQVDHGTVFEIRNSFFSNMDAVVTRTGKSVPLTVVANTFVNVGAALYGEVARSWRVESNLFISVDTVMAQERIYDYPVSFLNNTVIDSTIVYDAREKEQGDDGPITLSNNVFVGVAGLVSTPTGWTPFVTGTSNAIDQPSLEGAFVNAFPLLTDTLFEPLMGFVDPDTNDYQLTEASSLIDAGTDDLNEYAYDLAGNDRRFGSRVDIGAYESPFIPEPSTPTNSDLAVAFLAPPFAVYAYGGVSLSFSVTNNGPDPAENVEVTLVTPAAAIDLAIPSGTWSQSGSTFSSDLGTLLSGESVSFEVSYSVGGEEGTLEHQLSVLSNISDPISIDSDAASNSATTAITVECGTSTVYAQNPATQSWAAFSNHCELPSGWAVSQTAPEGFVPIGYDEAHGAGYDSGYAVGEASADEALATAESERDAALAAEAACASERAAALTAQAAAESARDVALAAQATAEAERDAALVVLTAAESDRNAAVAALATAIEERDAAQATLEQTQTELEVCLTELAPEPNSAILGWTAILALATVARVRRRRH